MKRKIAIIVLAVICSFAVALGLTACASRSDNPADTATHTHSYAWTDNGNGTHNGHCSVEGCDKPDINNESHVWGNDGKCTKCKSVKPNDKHTHSWSNVWSNNDTHHWHNCTASGCDITNNTRKNGYAAHTPGAAATETAAQTCTVCGYVITPPLGHTHSLTSTPANDPDCTHDGNTAYWYCSGCGKYFSDGNGNIEITFADTVRQKLGHDWKTEWTVDIEATTEHVGSKSHHCSRCDEKTDVTEISKLNQNEHNVTFVLNYPSAESTVKSTEDGLITYIPERAGYIFNGWWYSDGQTADGSYILSEKFDTSKRVTQSGLTLYAEWVSERTNDSQLYSPSVSISEEGVFGWNPVTNAQGYKVEVYSGTNKVTEQSLTTTSWTFPNSMTAGYYTVKVRANGDGEHTINSEYTSKYYPHLILASTSIQFDISTSTLTWSAVRNATTYEVRINNTLKDTITYTTYDMSDLDAGDYTVSVTAKRTGYTSSVTSSSITKRRLKTPTITTVTTNSSARTYTVSWQSVAHADTYRIKHHDTYISVTRTSYTIYDYSPIYDANGTGEFTVCAFDSNADYFISNDSERKTINRLYSVTLDRSDSYAGSVKGNNNYKSGDSATISATTNNGYTFIGWFDGNTKLTDNLSYTFTMPNKNKTYTAKWKVNDGLDNFIFTSTPTTLTITGIKDKTVTEIEIPNSVTSIGGSAFSDCGSLTSITIPNSVTSIGDEALRYCSSLTSITIPSSVTSIGDWAFDDCSKLTIYCEATSKPSNWKSYWNTACPIVWNCKNNNKDEHGYEYSIIDGLRYSLKYGIATIVGQPSNISGTITIPASVTFKGASYRVTSIGDSAFSRCSSLTNITIPNSVTSIGVWAFSGCSNLTIYCEATSKPSNWASDWNRSDCPIVWNCKNNNKDINGYEYSIIDGLRYSLKYGIATIVGQPSNISGTITIPKSVTYKDASYNVTGIGSSAFYNCSSLTSITIPNSVTSIGNYAFYNCSSLTSITIPNSVTSIGDWAFYNCSSLTSITIPNSVTSIGNYAFSDCSNLTSIEIPNSVTSIGDWAFSDCSNLTSIEIPNSVTSIRDWAFHNCSSLTSITIPNSVTSIGDEALRDCSSLTSITVAADNSNYASQDGILYNKVKTQFILIPRAITGSVTIPNSVTNIGDYAFQYCSSLTSITIPNSVTNIGDCAFQYCSSLTTYCEATSKPSNWKSYWNTACPIVWNCKNNNKDENGYEYSIIDGLRYSLKNGIATIVGQPSNISGTITIPASVTFKGASYRVTSIGDSAFSRCSSLTNITIPNGVTSIGDDAFWGCSSLTSITFQGTVEQWNALSKGFDWNLDTGNYTVYCNDGNIYK